MVDGGDFREVGESEAQEMGEERSEMGWEGIENDLQGLRDEEEVRTEIEREGGETNVVNGNSNRKRFPIFLVPQFVVNVDLQKNSERVQPSRHQLVDGRFNCFWMLIFDRKESHDALPEDEDCSRSSRRRMVLFGTKINHRTHQYLPLKL